MTSHFNKQGNYNFITSLSAKFRKTKINTCQINQLSIMSNDLKQINNFKNRDWNMH